MRRKRDHMGLYIGVERKSGGLYWHNGYTKRLCLWFVAITYIPDFEFDKAVRAYIWQEKIK